MTTSDTICHEMPAGEAVLVPQAAAPETSVTETVGRGTLLEELDARQNEVLDQLDALNLQVEALLKDWSAAQHDDVPDAVA